MSDNDEKRHGKELIQKHIDFLTDLKQIEDSYIEYFKSRQGKFIDDEHDYLHNHYSTRIVDGVVTFGILDNTDIDKEIQDKCLDAFKRHHQS